MSDIIPDGYLTFSEAIDRVVEITVKRETLREAVSVGTAREALARRGVLGSSFAADAVSRIQADFFGEATQTLRQLLLAKRVRSKVLTAGVLVTVPKHVWAGEQWDEALRFNKINFSTNGLRVSGEPLIPGEALEAAFNTDGAVKAEPDAVSPIEATPAKQQKRRGRKLKWDWDGAVAHLISVANTPDGLPAEQSDIERLVAKWFHKKFGDAPAESGIRTHVVAWCREILGEASN